MPPKGFKWRAIHTSWVYVGVQIFYSRYHISSLLPLIPLLEEGTIIFFVQGKNLRPRVCPKSQLFNVNVRIQTQVRCQILGLSSTQCCFSLGIGSLLVLLNRKTQISTLDASVSLPPLLAPMHIPWCLWVLHSFVISHKYSLSTYYISDTFLGPGNIVVNKSHYHFMEWWGTQTKTKTKASAPSQRIILKCTARGHINLTHRGPNKGTYWNTGVWIEKVNNLIIR